MNHQEGGPVILALALAFVMTFIVAIAVLWQPIFDHPPVPSTFNWAIQGQDDAIRGCPDRYSSWVEIDGHRYLESCWGEKNGVL
jgi:hypothetical protein